MDRNASSSKPGFSYFIGVVDRVMSRLLNLADLVSPGAGGCGCRGMFRKDEYGGGVEALLAPWDVDGRVKDGAGRARRSLDEARSWRAGEPERERDCDRESSFNRLVRSSCSNCFVRSLAQSSPNVPLPGGGGGG
jgi:hypothetical protein